MIDNEGDYSNFLECFGCKKRKSKFLKNIDIFVFSLTGFVILLSIASYFSSNKPTKAFRAVFVYGMQCIDVLTDILLFHEVLWKQNEKLIAFCILVFIVLPYLHIFIS